MNSEQNTVLDKALGGDNILLLGQSGTGKSYVVKEIARRHEERGTVQ